MTEDLARQMPQFQEFFTHRPNIDQTPQSPSVTCKIRNRALPPGDVEPLYGNRLSEMCNSRLRERSRIFPSTLDTFSFTD